MKKLFKTHQFLAGLLSILISVFLVAVFAYAATTIGTNINTGGTLTVTGDTTLSTASTSGDFWLGNVTADDDDYLYMDASSSEYLMWDEVPGHFEFSDDLVIGGNATTTGNFIIGASTWTNRPTSTLAVIGSFHATGISTSSDALWVGAGGTVNNLSMTAGDLYVQDDLEVDGSIWVDSATTTDSLAIGGYASSTGAINTQSNLHVGGNADVDGTFDIGGGNTITKFMFGTCDIAAATITASSTGFIECTGATGVTSGDKVFVFATSSLPTNYSIKAASTTNDNEISIEIINHGYTEAPADNTGIRTFYWMAIR